MRRRLNTLNPLNRNWGPNQGLVMRLLTLPNNGGGRQWFDIAGNNHGTLANGPTWPSMRRDNSFGCVLFDGSNDYVDLGSPLSLNLSGTMSIGMWIKLSTIAAGVTCPACDYNSAATLNQWGLGVNRSSGVFEFFHGNTIIAMTASVLTANVWTHITAVRRGSAGAWSVDLYVNGNLSVNGTSATNPSSQTTAAIARAGAFNGLYFQGSIDDLCITGRAWSDSEVKAHYLDGLTGYRKSLNWRRSVWAVPASGGGFQSHWARRQPQTIGGGIL